MDYQEAIEILSESFITDKPILETYYTDRDENAINTAISAIQELQDIKSDIDDNVEFLISELRQAKFDIETFWEEPTTLSKAIRHAISALVENQKYKQLGTLEEVRVVVEKQKPKKPVLSMNEKSGMFVDYADGHGEYKTQMNNWWRCPCCNPVVGQRVILRYRTHDQRKKKFCENCGQKIDWSVSE